MMPDLLVRAHVGEVAGVAASLKVSDLSAPERDAALCASEMPTAYRHRRTDDALVNFWIMQGAERLGLETLHHRSLLIRGSALLDLRGLATAEITARVEELFGGARRLRRARGLGSLSVLWRTPSREAIERDQKHDAAEYAWRELVGGELYTASGPGVIGPGGEGWF
jgi:hypothetical protein